MSISNNFKQKENDSFIQNPIDQGTDKRVHDIVSHDKLDTINTTLENLTITTDVDLDASTDSVKANLHDENGVAFSNSNPLPIEIIGSLPISATDLDIRDLTHVSDSVKIGDGTDFVAVNADGSLNITDNGGSLTVDGSVTVSASDLDIRDISHASDSIKLGDGIDFIEVNSDGSLNITDNGGSITVDGSVTVSATDLDVRDLSAASDSVSAHLKDESGNAFTTLNPLPVEVSGTVTTTTSPVYGTTDGTPSGTSRTFVNNRLKQLLDSHDLVKEYTWLDFGTRNERVSAIDYSSVALSISASRNFTYTQVGNNYRLDDETWSVSGGA